MVLNSWSLSLWVFHPNGLLDSFLRMAFIRLTKLLFAALQASILVYGDYSRDNGVVFMYNGRN